MKKIIFFLIITGLVFSGIFIVKKRKDLLNSFKSSAKKEVLADSCEVRKGSLDLKYKTSAEIRPDEIIKIISRTEGYVEFLEKEKGDFVSKGELIAILDTKIISEKIRAAQGEIKRLEAEKVFFEKRYSRNKSLLKGGGVSEDEYDKSKSDYEKVLGLMEKAKAEKDVLKQELEFSKIYSPCKGVVLETNAKRSEFVLKGKNLFEIENREKGFYAVLYLPKSFMPDINDNKVILSQNNKKISTSVEKINPKILKDSETIQVESKRFDLKDFYFPAGTKVTAVVIRKTVKGLVVHSDAVLSLKNYDYVFKISENNRVEKIQVDIKGTEGHMTVIDSMSVNENDRLVTGYPSFLMTLSNNTKLRL
jgi:RND family efflux transporter MFP subunit